MPEFLEYKGRPLVRKDNIVYYGSMSEKYIIRLEILSEKETEGKKNADRVKVDLILSDEAGHSKFKAVKSSEKNGLYEAMDIGVIWLERALK